MIARALFAVVMLAATTAARGDDMATTLRELLARYRCPVIDRLEQIYRATDTADPQNWFLIIYFATNPNDYLQCVFDTKTRMLCEAASGFYDDVATEPRTRRLPADAVAALVQLGFSADDSAGNFQVWFDVAEPPDLNAIAEFMLKALHDGFAARADDTLEFEAPLAKHATKKCAPVS
jgi:type III secretion system-like peptide-binding chaperone